MKPEIVVIDETGNEVFRSSGQLESEVWIAEELGIDEAALPECGVIRRHAKAFGSYSRQGRHFEMVWASDLGREFKA